MPDDSQTTVREMDPEVLWEANRALTEDIAPLLAALRTIRDLPMPEQDNMISANMRQIAREALGG